MYASRCSARAHKIDFPDIRYIYTLCARAQLYNTEAAAKALSRVFVPASSLFQRGGELREIEREKEVRCWVASYTATADAGLYED